MEEKIKKFKEMLDNSNNIVVFTGAGVSTESGIKDFRSKDGLYSQKFEYPAEYYLSSDCFYDKPDEFYKFYKDKMNCLDIKPNITHFFFKKLEDEGKLLGIITQNIDGLHTKAGSKKVYEIHGTIYKNHCTKCGKEYSAKEVFEKEGIPYCTCKGIIKPDVVLYGEMLPECFDEAIKLTTKADMLIVAGTSLTVYPANSIVRYFNGKYLVILNKDTTEYDNMASLVINEKLSKIFEMLEEGSE